MSELILVARVDFEIHPAVATRLPVWLAGAPPSARILAKAGAMEWRLSDAWQRCTRLDTKGKALWTVLRAQGNGAAQFWDHEAGTRCALGPEGSASKALPPLQALQIKLDDGIAFIEFVTPVLGRVRQQLNFSRDKAWPHAQRLLEAVMGCADCHASSGIPVAQLAELGMLQQVQSWLGDDPEPAFVSRVAVIEARKEAAADFKAPAKFKPLVLRPLQPPPMPPRADPPAPAPGAPREQAQDHLGPRMRAGINRQALDASGPQTPECLPSTRLGATALVIRQRLLDHLASAVNDIAPLLGTATLAGGTLSLPWFAALPSTPPTAPGSGLRNFVREPRAAATATTPASGGRGLVDRLAWQALNRRDASGRTRTEAEAAAGTLAATLASWGVSPAIAFTLVSTSGHLSALSEAELIQLVEAFEAAEWLTLTLSGLPSALPVPTAAAPSPVFTPPELAGLMSFAVAGIGGSLSFRPGVPLVSPLAIGANGDIDGMLMVPDIRFTATVIRFMTPTAFAVVAAVVTGACLLVPGLCLLLLPLATLIVLLANQMTTLDLITTNVSIGFNVRWSFDAAERKVLPVVTVTSTGGTATVTSRFSFPNAVANAFEGVLLGFANQFNAWVPPGAQVLAVALQDKLRQFGLTCPFGSDSRRLLAVDGGAASVVQDHLSLFANCEAEAGLLAMPYATQVASRGDEIAMRLDEAGRVMERDFDAAVSALRLNQTAAWLGVGYNQNALNQLLFQRWNSGDFRVDFAGAALAAMVQRMPMPWQALLGKATTAHLWCAVAPRVEFSSEGALKRERLLLAFFDDVRICFEAPPKPAQTEQPGSVTLVELAFNIKVSATLTLEWPAIAALRFDRLRFEPCDLRTWDWVDVSGLGTPTPAMSDLSGLVEDAALHLLALADAWQCQPILPSPAAWAETMPGHPQSLPALAAVPPALGSVYLELRAARRALHVLPAIRSDLLQLIDGSGAPLLQGMLGVSRPLTLGTLRAPEGTKLRDDFLGLLGPQTQLP